jgi:hypothetical protein
VKKILRLGHIKLGEITDSASGCPVVGIDLVDLVIFWIEEQSHRGERFGNNGIFEASNGLFLCSTPSIEPRFVPHTPGEVGAQLRVDGTPGGLHKDRKLLCTLDEWERIEAAVKEYNETEF